MANGVELVWEGKHKEVERIALPFQRVEVINESRGTRRELPLFSSTPSPGAERGLGGEVNGWRNKLIWGDNKYVLASLLAGDPLIGLEPLAGKVDLIYVDPPFATEADFTVSTAIGDGTRVTKEHSAIEETAYRDTWGQGLASYLQMLRDRIDLAKDLLSPSGKLVVHIGDKVAAAVKVVLDEILPSGYRNTIVVRRGTKNVQAQFEEIDALAVGSDFLLLYAKSSAKLPRLQHQTEEFEPGKWDTFWRGTDRRTMRYELLGVQPATGQWRWEQGRANKAVRNYEDFSGTNQDSLDDYYLDRLTAEGIDLDFVRLGPNGAVQYYVPPRGYKIMSNVWMDVMTRGSVTSYPTEKHEDLLRRIITWLTAEEELVLDFFVGSGTALSVAEAGNRRWVGCDLGRFAINTSKKRLLDTGNCRPFEVLNLGRYQRRYWQGINAGEAIYDYLKFIVELYHAEPITGFTHLHGRKGDHMVHVGATDAPVTLDEARSALAECRDNGFKVLDVLGWEWEMGLNDKGKRDLESEFGIELHLFHIPHEVMDKRAVEAGDVHFFEAAYVEATPHIDKNEVKVELSDFLVAIDDYMRDKVGDAVKKWSDWIDYWAVDFDYNGDVFHNQWQSYRTRKEPKLELISDPHIFTEPGDKQILVKVVDIFGNDTTALLEVTIN